MTAKALAKTTLDALRDYLRTRAQAYRLVFSGEPGRQVLLDLAKFCRAAQTTFTPDERATALLEGRREVWLRIQHHLKLSDDDLWELYQGGGRQKDAQ